MPIIQLLRVSVATIISLVGLIGVYRMFVAEQATATQFDAYFPWALGAGLVFVATGAAFALVDRNDETVVQYDDETSKQ